MTGRPCSLGARLTRLLRTSAVSICLASCAVRSWARSPPASPTPAPTCRAGRYAHDGDSGRHGYRLNGRKRWITNSCAADIMTTLCVVDGEHAMLLVDMHSDAIVVSEPDKKMGNRLQLTSDVEFTDVFVPDEHVIAEPGRGQAAALKSLSYGRMGVGAMGVGMGRCGFDHAVAHLRSRSAFGSKLGGFQHWQFRMAEHAIPSGGGPLAVPEGGTQVRHPRVG